MHTWLTPHHIFSAFAIGVLVLGTAYYVWSVDRKPRREPEEPVTRGCGNIFDDMAIPTPLCYKDHLPEARYGYSEEYRNYGITPADIERARTQPTTAANWSAITAARNTARQIDAANESAIFFNLTGGM